MFKTLEWLLILIHVMKPDYAILECKIFEHSNYCLV